MDDIELEAFLSPGTSIVSFSQSSDTITWDRQNVSDGLSTNEDDFENSLSMFENAPGPLVDEPLVSLLWHNATQNPSTWPQSESLFLHTTYFSDQDSRPLPPGIDAEVHADTIATKVYDPPWQTPIRASIGSVANRSTSPFNTSNYELCSSPNRFEYGPERLSLDQVYTGRVPLVNEAVKETGALFNDTKTWACVYQGCRKQFNERHRYKYAPARS